MSLHNGFGANPRLVNCRYCKKEVMTRVEINSTDNNKCIGLILCILGFWPCGLYMCICAESISDLTHNCPICENQLGIASATTAAALESSEDYGVTKYAYCTIAYSNTNKLTQVWLHQN